MAKRQKTAERCEEIQRADFNVMFLGHFVPLTTEKLISNGLFGNVVGWSLGMRDEIQEIVPCVFLSGFVGAKNLDTLQSL
eukprot:CAMPEP_0113852046 /NCGR_PEP_ID=MMETSP0372-20130328/5165_1 /TAXON_ID=340204 /ORGANISM="Lankesteria abbotti" /LENGTH=79 /DNA_ID=CAMNT_0000823297 /DNA_START=60 /DNA_END=295 /DNA_ORIENTATION=- /assembly_acc=CAM_ASM_000359